MPVRPGRTSSAVVLAALTAAAVWALLRLGRPPEGPPAAIRAITASEVPADRPLLLAWEGAGPPYRVTLRDGRNRELWTSGLLPEPLVPVPPDVRRRMAPGSTFVWHVEGIDARSRAVRSPDFRLTLVAPGRPAPARRAPRLVPFQSAVLTSASSPFARDRRPWFARRPYPSPLPG